MSQESFGGGGQGSYPPAGGVEDGIGNGWGHPAAAPAGPAPRAYCPPAIRYRFDSAQFDSALNGKVRVPCL
jgi:hypothetical protein